MGLGSWRKKGAPDAPPLLQQIGRRLLANLQRRREADPSVPSHATQVELPDGSVVRAQFVGSQPIVTVTPGRSSDTDVCVLRMESGMLDLGTPTSVSLGFWPSFDASKPLRYRGTLWDCAEDRKPGRRYRLTDLQLTMTCDDIDDEEPPESDACDPATRRWMTVTTPQKKQAQAVLPASMWTGLMRRYVQALYGAPGAAYRLNEFETEDQYQSNRDPYAWWAFLEVPTLDDEGDSWFPLTWGWETEGTVGIVDIGRLWFVRIEREGVKFRPLVFSGCGRKAYEASRRVPAGVVCDALVSVALSTALPGRVADEVLVAFDTPFEDSDSPFVVLRAAGRYGWSFNRAGDKASLVIAEYREQASSTAPASPHPQAMLYTITFSADDEGNPEIDLALVESADADLYILPFGGNPTLYVPTRHNLGLIHFPHSALSFPNSYAEPLDVDAPVFCYYDQADVLNVTRVKVENANPSTSSSGDDCFGRISLAPHLLHDGTECAASSSYVGASAAAGFYGPGWTTVQIDDWGVADGDVSNGACYLGFGTEWTDSRLLSGQGFAVGYYTEASADGCHCSNTWDVAVDCEATAPPGERDIQTQWIYTVRPYTSRQTTRRDYVQRPQELILPNGSASAPCARSHRVENERRLEVLTTEAERVVSLDQELVYFGYSCTGPTAVQRCDGAPGDTASGYTVPVDVTNALADPVLTAGARVSASSETIDVTVAFTVPLELPVLSGSWNVIFGTDPAGVACPCGPAMSASSSTHDPISANANGVGDGIPNFWTSGPGQYGVTFKVAESAGGAYSIVNDFGCRWAYADVPVPTNADRIAQQPWPLTSSHSLPETAGAYYSFVGWT